MRNALTRCLSWSLPANLSLSFLGSMQRTQKKKVLREIMLRVRNQKILRRCTYSASHREHVGKYRVQKSSSKYARERGRERLRDIYSFRKRLTRRAFSEERGPIIVQKSRFWPVVVNFWMKMAEFGQGLTQRLARGPKGAAWTHFDLFWADKASRRA